MFCSSCGLELPHELTYCSRCGNNLRPVGVQPVEAPASFKGAAPAFATAIALVTLVGMAMIFALVGTFIDRGIDLNRGPLALILISLLAVVSVDWMLVRVFMRILHLRPPTVYQSAPSPKNLADPIPRRLDEPRQPVDSVTDHTTRTLPPVFVERK